MAVTTAAQKAVDTKNAPSAANAANTKTSQAKTPLNEKVTQPIGIAVMIVLLVAALAIGNGRALSKAMPTAFLRQGEVASLIEERVASAKNVETVAKRADLEETLYTAVEDAASEESSAKTARAVSRADQKLMSAVGELDVATVGYLGSDTHLTSAMDTFNDAGNMLHYEADEYNEKAQKALDLYEQLPFKFLFSQPDYYEGL